ncbi:MAG TPA: hypothetical protein VGQ24_16615 [Gemmatimonadales bacterium]|jgi:hypothetical protein|nr:hypothetical protein [Gemmatimonadales bacterium]
MAHTPLSEKLIHSFRVPSEPVETGQRVAADVLADLKVKGYEK